MAAPFSEVRLTFLKLFFSLTTIYVLLATLTIPVHAQTERGDCKYEQKLENGGIEICNGAYQPADIDDESTPLVCRYNAAVPLDCKKQAAQPASPTPFDSGNIQVAKDANTAEKIGPDNYKAAQHSDYTIINLEHSMFCELAGMSPVSKCIGLVKEPGRPGTDATPVLYKQVPSGGAIGGLTNFVVAMYNPPTSTARYLADLGTNLGIVKPVYAQVGGSGAGIITPILKLWKAVRNIAYVAFIIVFVAVGLMIMFRARINPQTVISAQQALPGLVIGLVLVTFSYFIAALIIDVSFLSVQVVGQIFIDSGANNIFQNIDELKRNSNIAEMFAKSVRLDTVGEVAGGTLGTLSTLFGGGAGPVLIPAIIGSVLGFFIGGPFGAAVGAGAGAAALPIVSSLVGLIVPLILIIALLIQFLRLLFGLIQSYIALLVVTVAGPFIILVSSIPGRGGVMGVWWRSLLGNTLVFPAVFAAFLFAGVILGSSTESWRASPPLFGNLDTELLRVILAYGIILGTPAIPGMVRKAIGVPELGGIPQAALGGAITGGRLSQAGYTRFWQGGEGGSLQNPQGPVRWLGQAVQQRIPIIQRIPGQIFRPRRP